MLSSDDFIAIGKIVKPIGIKGNLKIIFLTDFPERFNKLKEVKLYSERDKEFAVNKFTGDSNFQIASCEVMGSYVSMGFENYNSIDLSRDLVNLIVMIDEKERIKLKEGNFYYYELTGCNVYDKNVWIGKVVSVDNYGSGDLFNVESGGKRFYIPYRDEFVKKIDLQNSRIDVELIEGFLEL